MSFKIFSYIKNCHSKFLRELYLVRKSISRGEYVPSGVFKTTSIKVNNPRNSDIIAILVHSWLGNTDELDFLEQFLNEHNVATVNLLLKGHGTRAEDLLNYTVNDWIFQLENAVEKVKKEFSYVYLIGQCGGGNVILNYLNENKDIHSINGIILASVPYFFTNELSYFGIFYNFIYRYIIKHLQKIIHPFYINKWMLEFDIPENKYVPATGYNSYYPLHAIAEGIELVRKTSKINLRNLYCPAMIIQYHNDYFLSTRHCEYLYRTINNSANVLLMPETQFSGHIGGHHILNNIQIHNEIFPQIKDFLDSTNNCS